MKPACPNPCSDCPFRKNSLPGWLGDWPSAAHLSGHVLAGNDYPCHMTMPDSSEYEDMGLDEPLSPHEIGDLIMYDSTECRGSILYREKRRAHITKSTEANAEHDNILSADEFIIHHKRPIS